MEEPQTWTQIGQYSGGPVGLRRKCCRCSWLIVVLKKPSRLLLKLSVRSEMVTHWPRVHVAEAIIESLVVRVVETLLLKCPFEVPVDFRHKRKSGLLERIDRVTLGQNGFIRRPQVRSKTSERINMAMSHRTPSHFSAMLSNSNCMASCNDDSA